MSSTGFILTSPTDIILYSTLGTVNNAAQLAADLSGPVGYISFASATTSGGIYDMLVAYSNGTAINIADVQFHGNGTADTEGMTISASDMVSITGQTSLLTLGTHIADIQIVHV